MKVQDGKFKLQDLMVIPMQRVLKYHLLLKVRRSGRSRHHCLADFSGQGAVLAPPIGGDV